MIEKLLALVGSAKAAAVVGVIFATAVTGGVAATNSDVQETVGSAAQGLGHNVGQLVADVSNIGQPPVVAARNDADKRLRSAFQDEHQALERLRRTKVEGSDRQKLNQVVGDADDALRARLTLALDDVGALTLGRNGRIAAPSASPSVPPLASPPGTISPNSSTGGAHLIPVDQAAIDAIVAAAITDMHTIVVNATAQIGVLPTFTPGKPSDAPGGGKPSNAPGGKPSDVPGGKPSNAPGGQPSDNPGNRPSGVPGGRPSDVPRGGPNS